MNKTKMVNVTRNDNQQKININLDSQRPEQEDLPGANNYNKADKIFQTADPPRRIRIASSDFGKMNYI